MLELDEERTSPTLIKVVGIGGGGMNAVNRMIDANLKGVEFYVVNTDEQVLKKSVADHRIQIGQRATRGMGAGGDPDVGMRAAMEDKETIAQALKGADMVFITAGMGGGTGTGAAPIVAEVAKESGALAVGVVTLPFEVEGRKRMELARHGIESLREQTDTLITIKNESLFKVIDRSTSVNVAFRMVDDILLNAVKGLSDLINTAGIVNVDFADVRSIMNETGDAIMGAGEGVGENRVSDAVSQAINNVLLEESSIEGATALLINVCGGEDMSITEWKEVSEIITERADPRANIIIGLTIEDSLREKIRVTVIATGFRKKKSESAPLRLAAGQGSWKDYQATGIAASGNGGDYRRPALSLRQQEAEPIRESLAYPEQIPGVPGYSHTKENFAAAPAFIPEPIREPISETMRDREAYRSTGDGLDRSLDGSSTGAGSAAQERKPAAPMERGDVRSRFPEALDPDDLDIPAYLRRRSD